MKGLVYLDQDLFAAGFLPAIDIARSVSRIGGKAQPPAIKREAGRTKLDYLQFLELEVFTRVGARLEAGMEARIARGRILRELLRQDRLEPQPIRLQLAWLVAFNDGLLSDIAAEALPDVWRRLREGVEDCGLALDSPRGDWSAAVRDWLGAGLQAAETVSAGGPS